jgi:hypothetical protein
MQIHSTAYLQLYISHNNANTVRVPRRVHSHITPKNARIGEENQDENHCHHWL